MSYEKEANKQYLKSRYKIQREYLISLLGDCCNKCKSKENLQFDHIDPEQKSFSVGKLWSIKDLPKVIKELEKCQLLCEKCHVEKTTEENKNRPETFRHGTMYAWMKKKCDCEVCFLARSEHNRKRRSNSKNKYGEYAEHGTTKRYNRGCKCVECKAANAKKERERRAKIKAAE